MSQSNLTERLRPALLARFVVYVAVLMGVLVAPGEPEGESDVEWLYLLPVPTAVAMARFSSVGRPESEARR